MPLPYFGYWARLVAIETNTDGRASRRENPLGLPIGSLWMVGYVHERELTEIRILDFGRSELELERFEYVHLLIPNY